MAAPSGYVDGFKAGHLAGYNLAKQEHEWTAARLAEVEEFAREIVGYEVSHAAGSDTPTRLAIAHDLLDIIGGADA